MNKSILAISLASILSAGAANAATIYEHDNGDFASVYGSAEVGGFFVSDTDHSPKNEPHTYIDNSFATIGLKGATGNFFAKAELDLERDGSRGNDFRIVVDKLFVGYELAADHTFEFGRTDTAYDHYDGYGDVTDELGVQISEASDQDKTIKYRGVFGKVKLGISHSLEGWDGDLDEFDNPVVGSNTTDSIYSNVTNGYIGYFGDTFKILTAAEKSDETEIYSLHAKLQLDKVTISGLVFDQTKQKFKNADSSSNKIGANLGVSYAFNGQLDLIGNLNYVDVEDSDTSEYIVIGAAYSYAENVKFVAEVALGEVLSDGEDGAIVWTKAYYWF